MLVSSSCSLWVMKLCLFGKISPGTFLCICCQFSLSWLNIINALKFVIHLRMVIKKTSLEPMWSVQPLFCVLVISDHMDDIMNDDLKMTTLAHDEKYIKNQIHEGKNSIWYILTLNKYVLAPTEGQLYFSGKQDTTLLLWGTGKEKWEVIKFRDK